MRGGAIPISSTRSGILIPMHVALVSPGWPPEKFTNGIVTYVRWMREELLLSGHTVTVLAHRLETVEPGVHLVRRGRLDRLRDWATDRPSASAQGVGGFGAVLAGAIKAVDRASPIDIVEMEETFGWAADVARLTRIPIVMKLHGPACMTLLESERRTEAGEARIANEGEAFRRVQVITAPSRTTLDSTLAFYGVQPRLAVHVVNPLTLPKSAPLWQIERCDPRVILFVGRFDDLKGADVVLHAFARVLTTHPNIRLVFVGPDNGVSGPDGRMMHFHEFTSGLFPGRSLDQIRFLGTVPPDEINRLRVQALVTIVASRWENQSYTTLEAMLQGCPLVSSDAGGQVEIVEDGVTGLLARSGSAVDLAEKLLSLIDRPKWAAALGAKARAYVLDRHRPQRVVEETLRVYTAAIRLKRPAEVE